jgi:DNA-binding transcriptional MerR regulator
MIRYYEQRGVIRGARARDGHRRYTDDDVRRLRRLRALLAANIAPERAERAIDADLPGPERRQVRRALELLIAEAQEAHARLDAAPGRDADDEPPEQRISLMFDTFMMRTRMETVLTAALQPAGIRSGDYAVVSLIAVEGSMTPATLARLVGVAPSSLAGRVERLLRWGWIQRYPAVEDPHCSWRLELTRAGVEVLQAAVPHARVCAQRIDAALQDRGVEPDSIRAGLITLSTALRSLLPNSR